ncbi:MAG TPA: 30S ribosomal protein S6 [Tepidisphaeraceae bacterium]|jgi:small subunit ribosomal protein S6|nr:30S ribosomal protein S6 [Tepidisphaeraceae bacterium]
MAAKEKQYEAMFLFGSSTAADTDGAIATARGIVERHQGNLLVIKKWDERKLAYEINKQKRGTYIICYFTAPTTAVAAIERDAKLNEQVLRVLITTADHLNKDEMAAVEPQPIQPREERNPWDRPYEGGGGFGGGGFGGGGGGAGRGDRGDRPPRGPRREESPEPAAEPAGQ